MPKSHSTGWSRSGSGALIARTVANEGINLRDIFGDKYVEDMTPTPLIKRLNRMKSEIDRGEESLERKLRYLLWLN